MGECRERNVRKARVKGGGRRRDTEMGMCSRGEGRLAFNRYHTILECSGRVFLQAVFAHLVSFFDTEGSSVSVVGI